MRKLKLKIGVLLLLLLISTARSAIIYYNTTNYKGRADNPFLNKLTGGVLYVEDFERQGDGSRPAYQMSTPNSTGWNGLASGSFHWGVQEDYSNDQLGHRWTDSGGSSSTEKPPDGIHYDFTPDEQGRFPECVGAALRGFGLLGNGPAFNVILVYDRNGVEVTEGAWQIPKPVPDPNMPIEDLFLNFEGIYVPGGISRIHFRDFSEVDHLTYGYAIPEPGSLVLAAAGAAALLTRRRSRIRP